jgi:hypothetical protein
VKQIAASKHRLLERILDGLSPDQKPLFQRRLRLAQKSFATRDDHSFEIDETYYAYVRLAAAHAAEKLIVSGTLHDGNDIWLFSLEELLAHFKGEVAISSDLLK